MFPDGMDMSALMAQAQQMQAQLAQVQEELRTSEFVGTAGGDLVEATMTGDGQVTGLVIKPEAIDPSDAEGLADLVLAAIRDAMAKAQAKTEELMPQLPDMGQLGF